MAGEMEKEKGTCRCGRDLYDDKHCIFHSKDIEGKRAEFNKKFWKEFERQKEHEKEYNFIGFVFPGDISFMEKIFEKYVSFVAAQFSGKATFSGAQFFEAANFAVAQFSGETSFLKAQFSRKTAFLKARFSGEADFNDAQFSEEVKFWAAQFSGETSFWHAQFSEEADFNDAQFSGKTKFWKTQFSGKTIFWKAQFSEEASFMDAQFSGEAYFEMAQFSEYADFRNAEFHSKSFFTGVKFEDFNQCNMTDTSFYNVFGLLEFIAENRNRFKHPKGIKYLHGCCKPSLGEPTVSRLPLLSREIRDDLYLMSFKEKHPKLHFIWWLLADCGRSFFRWALWALGLALLFGLIYLFIGPTGFKPKPEGYTWFSFFYYSIVTFTTLGFGDITPVKWYTEILVTIEVILGYIMLGGLISILANKLARRS